jgi:hypothetical protein
MSYINFFFAEGGVIGSCGELCGYLNNEIEATVCDLICDYVGVEEFVNLIQEYISF